MSQRVVFDTSVVISALLFGSGRLAWLRQHWRDGACVPLISLETSAELTRVLAYPKFRLSPEDRHELLSGYLPYCEIVESTITCEVMCRDTKDQSFLNLAQSGKAEFLVTGDEDLLDLAGKTSFLIVPVTAYERAVFRS